MELQKVKAKKEALMAPFLASQIEIIKDFSN